MRALICNEFGPVESHKIERVDDPIAGPGQVVVDIKATGISFPRCANSSRAISIQATLPFSPGGEISGIVSSVGEGVTQFKEGDRVVGSVEALVD